jgi:predicted metal-dependent peptidase
MNANMLCPLRTGQGRIEYNPAIIEMLQDNQLHDLMKVEIIRILLQHPYARQPLGCPPVFMQKASDMVISPAYKLSWISLTCPEDMGLPVGQHYEWYAMRLNDMAINRGGGAPSEDDTGEEQEGGEESDSTQGHDTCGEGSIEKAKRQGESEGTQGRGNEDEEQSADYTALWEEDQFLARQITDIVQSTTNWGMMPAGMVELIKKAAEGKIDFRGTLRTFRASILSQKRRLTRMRPSRRFEFEQMGSHYDFKTRLLIAIDTSGSVGSEELARYLRIISTFFKYGLEEVDVLMFDTEVQGNPLTIKYSRKHLDSLLIKGRGGTNFQAPVDYVKDHPGYDGLVIITDGYAPVPDVPAHLRAKLLWIIDNEKSFETHYKDLRVTGRVCLMQL